MLYIKPKCNSFAGMDIADVAQTAYLHVFFEQVAKLDAKPTRAVVQMVKTNSTETIHTIEELA